MALIRCNLQDERGSSHFTAGHHCGTDLPALPVPEHDVLKRVSCRKDEGFVSGIPEVRHELIDEACSGEHETHVAVLL